MDVFIDMDSTMNDFTKGYVDYYNKLHGTNHTINPKDLVQYEISKCIPGISEEDAVNARSRVFCEPGFWVDIPPQKNMVKTVEWIYNNFNTYILTAPWVEYLDCAKEKYQWIQNHLPFFSLERVIFMHNKSLVHPNSILIDDNTKNLLNFRGKTVKFMHKYNELTPANYDAKNWNKVMSIMKKIKRIYG